MNTVGVVLSLLVSAASFLAGYAFKGFRIQQVTAAKQKAIDEEMDRRIDEIAIKYKRLRAQKRAEQMKELLK